MFRKQKNASSSMFEIVNFVVCQRWVPLFFNLIEKKKPKEKTGYFYASRFLLNQLARDQKVCSHWFSCSLHIFELKQIAKVFMICFMLTKTLLISVKTAATERYCVFHVSHFKIFETLVTW